ncbi:TetR/AcrR family transcriptional regulator [Antrihabitans cavernicola]|uniref:TetR/AcrR family transcriptional regulator n=1 Tax=Antrihabitans cavernicola TaxID=2495913 RepID=A0A5A7S1Q8_9NOCA|nr:TetR/AcrR family transcriptional regulator [Spelaeibacter cavernicola]KAA0016505.1 TetR/AcrR family transcriptional regulator [Spelaeibacter cavernicola]
MPPVDRRQHLIDTARDLFMRRPYEQVTTSEIAKAAGVAYGLIAHHFENKRGLYLAVMSAIADELLANRDAPLASGTLHDQLRHALTNHITFIDKHSASFVAIITGGLGADPDMRAMVDALRWSGAQRILDGLGLAAPIPPAVRTTMRGWVGYLDEMMIDRITHADIAIDSLVELAAANLVTSLRTALQLDSTGVASTTVEIVETLHREL